MYMYSIHVCTKYMTVYVHVLNFQIYDESFVVCYCCNIKL